MLGVISLGERLLVDMGVLRESLVTIVNKGSGMLSDVLQIPVSVERRRRPVVGRGAARRVRDLQTSAWSLTRY